MSAVGIGGRYSDPVVGWIARTLLYYLAGGLVGFLVLGEFALGTSIPVLVGLLVVALMSVIGGVRRRSSSAWSVFLLAAMVVPLIFQGQIVDLPPCAEAPSRVRCVGSDRDYRSPFWLQVAIFGIAAAGSALHLRTVRRSPRTP
jgi:hypothetical protein